jgi:hypothetical protein
VLPDGAERLVCIRSGINVKGPALRHQEFAPCKQKVLVIVYK